MIGTHQVSATRLTEDAAHRLKPHRRWPAPRGSVQPIVSEVPPGLLVKARLCFLALRIQSSAFCRRLGVSYACAVR